MDAFTETFLRQRVIINPETKEIEVRAVCSDGVGYTYFTVGQMPHPVTERDVSGGSSNKIPSRSRGSAEPLSGACGYKNQV
ncbi:CUN009 hypothetical protein [Culex nigripalpus nucleopolyhedrovirus]|uniref:Uncharacterized protein n=1 Tax=Culex nigripalpus nucleopolyhedrovirus (isolate Florida/1997) TaxID=645993 RepID=Q919Q6_NPVCO|nr:CUN009 hypothetical protein [Culex nigripalpus nucleopolyhedrovirus]AAK94087.1 CUN009 hypothetical protein [Culex nigripalpus nucleopolyhedrovirus]